MVDKVFIPKRFVIVGSLKAPFTSEPLWLKSMGHQVEFAAQTVAPLLNGGTIALVYGDPELLITVANIHQGPIFYRCSHTPELLSERLFDLGAIRLIDEHPCFFYAVLEANVASQEHCWMRERSHVVPAGDQTQFENKMKELLALSASPPSPRLSLLQGALSSNTRPTVYVLFHFRQGIIRFNNGQSFSVEGIPRVIRRVVHALLEATQLNVTVTCDNDTVLATMDYFYDPVYRGRLRFLLRQPMMTKPHSARWTIHRLMEWFVRLKSRIALAMDARRFPAWILNGVAGIHPRIHAMGIDRRYIQIINSDNTAHSVLVPHYLNFPESLYVNPPLYLYLPDFIPGFFPDSYHSLNEHLNMLIGRGICRKADKILTNSNFTKNYLPKTDLAPEARKIQVLPIPLLITPSVVKDVSDNISIPGGSSNVRYLFYPTQNRPNKRLDFALRVFSQAKKQWPGLRLVLTCSIRDYPPAEAAFLDYQLQDDIDFFPGVSDDQLKHLYGNASVLLFSSVFEGNFPPQVFEALSMNTPVVASDIPVIREVLGETADNMLLAKPLDLSDFMDKLQVALTSREVVQARQVLVLKHILKQADDEAFRLSVASLYSGITATSGMDFEAAKISVPK